MNNVSLLLSKTCSFTLLKPSVNFNLDIICLLFPSITFSKSAEIFLFVYKHHLVFSFLIISLTESPFSHQLISLIPLLLYFFKNTAFGHCPYFLITHNVFQLYFCIISPLNLILFNNIWKLNTTASKDHPLSYFLLAISAGFHIVNSSSCPQNTLLLVSA